MSMKAAPHAVMKFRMHKCKVMRLCLLVQLVYVQLVYVQLVYVQLVYVQLIYVQSCTVVPARMMILLQPGFTTYSQVYSCDHVRQLALDAPIHAHSLRAAARDKAEG
jgi:hypothetical protein